ncbi:MAG: urea carboxylase-associated family protein [Halomonadaceae bacterium]|nr:MAG: urea carboxylase-associated family protein [Halomonadaceae bacterium]
MSQTLYTTTLPGGHHWSFRMRPGTALRLTDLQGGANVGMLMYNPENLLERYNAPDSLKGQHTFKLTRGNCLYSDMGRCFASITQDSFGWHDTVCGNLTKANLRQKYGHNSYQQHRNDWTLSGEESVLTELAKYGLGERDLASNLNLFSKVTTDDEGRLQFDASAARAGASVALRFDMDALVVLHSCPHPLNPATEYPRRPVQLEFLKAAPIGADDECLNHRPENRRALENNRLYYLDQPVSFMPEGGQS